ncbi:MAG: hypothetical protein NWF08_01575, partial [Candidatus Bathyarchaeota archaeon]|nr:hypothetical protein [Candidatus Bathyarchaeota archaeon]
MSNVRRKLLAYIRIFVAIALMLILFPIPSSYSQPINHGFETGDLSGWSSQGSVEVLQASEFTATITPPEGQYFVLLSTGP